jgi:hypothetical protein
VPVRLAPARPRKALEAFAAGLDTLARGDFAGLRLARRETIGLPRGGHDEAVLPDQVGRLAFLCNNTE